MKKKERKKKIKRVSNQARMRGKEIKEEGETKRK